MLCLSIMNTGGCYSEMFVILEPIGNNIKCIEEVIGFPFCHNCMRSVALIIY